MTGGHNYESWTNVTASECRAATLPGYIHPRGGVSHSPSCRDILQPETRRPSAPQDENEEYEAFLEVQLKGGLPRLLSGKMDPFASPCRLSSKVLRSDTRGRCLQDADQDRVYYVIILTYCYRYSWAVHTQEDPYQRQIGLYTILTKTNK